MAMKMQGEVTLPADKATVWAKLNDAETLKAYAEEDFTGYYTENPAAVFAGNPELRESDPAYRDAKNLYEALTAQRYAIALAKQPSRRITSGGKRHALLA